jgi:UDP-glucose 4-epimerase
MLPATTMKLLITGALGFIGGSVGRFATARGHEVLGASRAPAARPGAPFRVAVAEGEQALLALVEGFAPDAVLHAAGKASVGASLTSPREDFEGAVLTWVTLLEAVRRSSQRPLLVLLSSAAVYGDPERLPVAEDAPARPISPYGFHKRACELLADEYASCFGLDVTVARLFSVFGPAQRRLLVWEIFEQLRGPAPEAWLQGTGQETRDFLHVDDVADALLRVAAARGPGGRAEVLNVASGEETAVRDLAERIRDRVAPGKRIGCRGVERPGDPRRWRADVTRLDARIGGFCPRPLDEALGECLAAFLAGESGAGGESA